MVKLLHPCVYLAFDCAATQSDRKLKTQPRWKCVIAECIYVIYSQNYVVVVAGAKVLENIKLESAIVGLNILIVTSWYVTTTWAWFPEIKNNGNKMEKTQPDTTWLSG